MFDDALITDLKTYASVVGYVSSLAVSGNTNSIPAVFSRCAPDNAVYPYIIVRINISNGGMHIIDSANVYIDLYEENSSAVNQIAVANDILERLDLKSLSNTVYSSIRFSRSSWGAVDELRYNFKQYNIQFECRMTRKAWNQSKF